MRQQITQPLLLSLIFSGAEAFVAAPQSARQQTSLNLLPCQGNQLKAAYNAGTCKSDETTATGTQEVVVEEQNRGPAAAARSFASRLFSLPSSVIKRYPNHEAEEIPEGFSVWRRKEKKQDDVVLYPVIGFHFVQSDGRFIALPTVSHASCPIHRNQDEDVFGWYSPACKLDHFAEDPCHKPEMN
jgi:hypothetical protein